MDRRLYPSYRDNWDDELFRRRVLSVLASGDDLLDLGAGSGRLAAMDFRGFAKSITGIDPDERVLDNPYLDEAFIGIGEALPFPDKTFDVVVSDNVFEHLSQPRDVLAEIRRVLRPGGRLLVKTTNRHHYIALIARATPHRFHEWFNLKRGRPTDDTYPTRYLLNDRKTLRREATRGGWRVEEIQMIEGRPEYTRVNPILYLLGFLYERAVNGTELLAGLRAVMVVQLVRPMET